MRGRSKGWNGTLRERFERKYIPEPNSGCWLWIGAIGGRDGRAMIGMYGKVSYASHVSWLLFRCDFPLSPKDKVLHSCDIPSCVNPDHLWLGSQTDNVRDCKKKGRLKPPVGYSFLGESHGRAKLTEANVLEIRTGVLSNKEYAKKFGVHPVCVSHVKLRKTWKHLA